MAETPYSVTYNEVSPWMNGAPFVSLDVEEVYVAGQIGTIRTVTLNGVLPSGGASLITGIQNVFSSNFKTFSAPNVTMPNAMVQEVTFGSQNFIGKTDYSIVLKDFSGFLYGVSSPVDEVNYQTEQDGSVTINHKVSAVGIDVAANISTAWNNACSFVRGRTGLSNIGKVGTSFVSKVNSGNMFLLSQQENINRVQGSYSVLETFRYDPLRDTANGTFKRFSVSLTSGIADDYISVEIAGSYSVGSDVWNTGIYAQIIPTDFYNLAFALSNDINPSPLSFGVESASINQTVGGTMGTRTINAKAVYDNSPTASIFDYDIEGSKDFRNGISQISIKGVIIGSGRHVRRKFDSAFSFYTTEVGGWNGVQNYLFNVAVSGANDIGYTGFPLNPSAKSLSVTFNSGQGFININASFDDAPFVSGYSEFGWGVATDCGLNVFKPYASANQNGSYIIQDLNIINRNNVALNGSFAYSVTGIADLSDSINILTYLKRLEGIENAFLESESYNKGSGDSIKTGFNYTYTNEGRSLEVIPLNGKIFAGITI